MVPLIALTLLLTLQPLTSALPSRHHRLPSHRPHSHSHGQKQARDFSTVYTLIRGDGSLETISLAVPTSAASIEAPVLPLNAGYLAMGGSAEGVVKSGVDGGFELPVNKYALNDTVGTEGEGPFETQTGPLPTPSPADTSPTTTPTTPEPTEAAAPSSGSSITSDPSSAATTSTEAITISANERTLPTAPIPVVTSASAVATSAAAAATSEVVKAAEPTVMQAAAEDESAGGGEGFDTQTARLPTETSAGEASYSAAEAASTPAPTAAPTPVSAPAEPAETANAPPEGNAGAKDLFETQTGRLPTSTSAGDATSAAAEPGKHTAAPKPTKADPDSVAGTFETQTGRLPAATGSAGASSGVLFPITGESAAGTGTRSKGTSTNTKSGVVIGTTTAAGPLATSTGKAGNTTYALVVNPQAGIQKFIPFMIEAEVGSTVDIQVYGNGAGLKIVETQGGKICEKSIESDAFSDDLSDSKKPVSLKITSTEPIYIANADAAICQEGMYAVINPAKPTGAIPAAANGTVVEGTVKDNVQAWAAGSPQNQASLDAIAQASGMTSQILSWGDDFGIGGLAGSSLQSFVESVLYTRMTMSMNPQLQKMYASQSESNSTTPMSSRTATPATEMTLGTTTYGGNAGQTEAAGRNSGGGCSGYVTATASVYMTALVLVFGAALL